MAIKGTRLFLPLINYAFEENFTKETNITAIANDAMKSDEENNQQMLATDATFQIGEKENFCFFILEEQTWKDPKIFQRLCEYMLAQANMHLVEMVEAGEIALPQVGVINVREKQMPREMKLRYGKQSIDISARVINMQDFKGVDDLVKHGLNSTVRWEAPNR